MTRMDSRWKLLFFHKSRWPQFSTHKRWHVDTVWFFFLERTKPLPNFTESYAKQRKIPGLVVSKLFWRDLLAEKTSDQPLTGSNLHSRCRFFSGHLLNNSSGCPNRSNIITFLGLNSTGAIRIFKNDLSFGQQRAKPDLFALLICKIQLWTPKSESSLKLPLLLVLKVCGSSPVKFESRS